MKLFLFCLSFSLVLTAWSQRTIDVNKTENNNVVSSNFFTVGGEPFVTAKFVSLVEGTPYFQDEWMKGVVITKSGQQFKDISLKLDLYDNELHYLNLEGKEYIATTQVAEVVLTDTGDNNYRFIHASQLAPPVSPMKKGWYQWLCSGNASLYKMFKKTLFETRQYGSATTEQHIQTVPVYLIQYNNSLYQVKKLKEVPGILSDKKKELEEFLDKKDKKEASMDDRYLALVEYYNGLFREQK